MDEGLDLNKVLDKSASSISVEELSRKGFRTVKVLNRESIQRLILEAVDRVLKDRAEEIGREERDRIFAESRAEFDRLLAERMARERAGLVEAQEKIEAEWAAIAGVRAQLAEEKLRIVGERSQLAEERSQLAEERAVLRTQAERIAHHDHEERSDLRDMLASLVAEVRAPAAHATGISEIRDLIESLGRRIGSGGSGRVGPEDAEALAAASLALNEERGLESNLDRVDVKQTTTGGVRGTLAKLKSMKSGGEGGAAGQ